ncbi:hypothetical protein N9026_01005 [bacterium]|nr:hypothetical protein [bacterium]
MDNDSDYREAWADEGTKQRHRAKEFLFREAGVDRFNDVFDDDETDEERS